MNIGGEDRPFNFGMNVWIEYCELRGISITEMGEQLDDFAQGKTSGAEMRDLLWASLKDGARKAKKDFPFDKYDIGDWMDELSADEMTSFMDEMAKSMASKIPSENGGVKKKVAESSQ